MKKDFQTLMYTIIAIVLFTACSTTSEVKTAGTAISSDSAKAIIAARNMLYSNAVAKKDSSSFVNCYTDSLCLLPPNAPEICTKDGVGKFFSMMQQMGIQGLLFSTKELFIGNEVITETGTYDLQIANNQSIDKGKYIVVWKQENGTWKMHRDIYNSDMPPAPMSAAK